MELIQRPCSPVDSALGTSTDLHLVDVGGVVSEATEGGDGLAAAGPALNHVDLAAKMLIIQCIFLFDFRRRL